MAESFETLNPALSDTPPTTRPHVLRLLLIVCFFPPVWKKYTQIVHDNECLLIYLAMFTRILNIQSALEAHFLPYPLRHAMCKVYAYTSSNIS